MIDRQKIFFFLDEVTIGEERILGGKVRKNFVWFHPIAVGWAEVIRIARVDVAFEGCRFGTCK